MPKLTAKTAQALHNLAYKATEMSASVAGSEVEAYLAGIGSIEQVKKAAFLGVKAANAGEIDREDLAAAIVEGTEMRVGQAIITGPDQDALTLLRVALLATDQDEFTVEELENTLLPGEGSDRKQLAHRVNDFSAHLQRTEQGVHKLLEEIDEIVAKGLGLAAREHDTIRRRCQQFPLSVTVERPRFAWSADRKTQERRVYRSGERFK